MTYAQQGHVPAYRVTKRPLTDEEAKGLAKPFKSFKGPLFFFSLVGVVASAASFEAPAENVGVLALMGFICGVIAIALGATSLKVRANVAKSMADSSVTLVSGTATRSVTAAGWAIGPVTVKDTPETIPLLRPGPASVEFIPPLKAAVSVNGVRLAKGAFVEGVLDLQPTVEAQVPAASAQYLQPSHSDVPPPPPDMESQGYFCVSCGAKNPPGARFCQQCARELPKL